MKKVLVVGMVWATLTTQAQNNPIFNGGASDGWDKTSHQQAANNIFTGGNADGWNYNAFSQPGNTIFNGGAGDGWNYTTYLQAGNAIFNGGEGDGWNFTTYLQAGNSIFNGGEGDGWSSTYRPMGPLPVQYLYFNAGKLNDKAALLQWETSSEANSAAFEVERSQDALQFLRIGTLPAAGNSMTPRSYRFTDYQPQPGLNYYRLKQVDKDGGYTYTPARVVRFDNLETGSVKYYPNPTHGMLNIELPQDMANEVKLINVSNAAGIMIAQRRETANGPGIIHLDMSRFAKGIYFVQVTTKSSNSMHRIVLQ
ncbi:MAG: T9SS type A sorting domain-containing protein [Sphingobacteriales bacterium]|nr:MAG: T9SS type A sorting domain-containing protein [Sphingobacteriales bacterium]